ncbi:hypothetical protein PF005_g12062 [Phytophthora fragariae]|uniref:Secreted protein n=1 Tax=Phytophthora fragariae TaxID=53985 RepID=A0A6A3RL78_9STRA|nr:hypothetical protein PF003_g6027 [Phytophthora fragariae]KAE8933070.1 hypothetical protein PF009_g16917 [Phytophthora fragariae]KAE8998507.1 hypothetical protein PF011_g15024 [Phytophthora fragariae]KAE9098636.1 hypothetical protein PF007_g16189 [Phytophthora fragariae]KAE9099135.1 hypothetical protein PF010_g15303 [Phytophthora fragariae]
MRCLFYAMVPEAYLALVLSLPPHPRPPRRLRQRFLRYHSIHLRRTSGTPTVIIDVQWGGDFCRKDEFPVRFGSSFCVEYRTGIYN